ncbi:hypothetical protein [Lysobacter sp. HA18]
MRLSNYLLNTSVKSSDPRALSDAIAKGGEVLEVGECVYGLPLPWLACFRTEDLSPGAILLEDGVAEVALPCVDVATARERLEAAAPLFEQLAEGSPAARAWHRHALDGLAALRLPYLTLDIGGLLAVDSPESAADMVERAIAWGDDWLDVFTGEITAYTSGVPPYLPEAFHANQGIDDDTRIENTVAFDPAFDPNPLARPAT